MTNTNTKGALASSTVWGGVVAALPLVLQIAQIFGFGIGIDPTQAATTTVSAIGGILAIWGRAKASKSITGLF